MRTLLVGSLVCMAGLAAFGGAFMACDNADACAFHRCDNPPDAGPAARCDSVQDLKDNADCIDDQVGIFVSLSGLDTNNGTKASPVATIGAALDKAGTTKKFIYVCDGKYTGPVTINANRSVSLYGGFKCGATWEIAADAKVTLESPDASPALVVENTSRAITIADIAFTSKPATAPGGSSNAVRVASSQDVTFKRVSITAGAGADADPTIPKYDPVSPSVAPKGNDSDGGAPGDPAVNVCPGLDAPNDKSTGAIGGAKGEDGGTGAPLIGERPAGNTGAGGDSHLNCPAGGGTPGAYGVPGKQAGDVSPLGNATASGYVAPKSNPGGNGGTAQGGGGGAGKPGGPGGGGGAGGCGGKGGEGGKTGGSSIALLVFKTKVRLQQVTLTADKAGKGGPGGAGQKAQSRGAGSTDVGGGCAGASGGHGASGAGGNGGVGGSSLALAYSGAVPNIDGVDVPDAPNRPGWTVASSPAQGGAFGAKGEGPAAGANLDGEDGRPGTPGVAKAVQALSP